MEKSRYGGNKRGLGLYELMVVPHDVYDQAIAAIKENRVEDFYVLLGLESERAENKADYNENYKKEHGRILIIEDKEELAVAVEQALRRRGYNIMYSPEKSGLQKVEQKHIDLIILDLRLPGVDVLNLCRILRDNAITCHIPVIVINGYRDEESIIEGLKAGADDYIEEGFSIEELAARVKAVLRTYH